ncbi:MAG: hypothetical protein M0R46_12310 [Candidatus Muirbacterium halophilum]|nr:hypothetical protein [Candidatus Muirbacterium halophilum]MCK9476700.1 hypothetical protein [Candidatus Muirbacterium halophilum]
MSSGEFYKKFGIGFGFFVFLWYFLFIWMLPSAFKMFLSVIKESIKDK